EVRELFIMRSRVIAAVRSYLDAEGFLEVETPVLQPLYGGAVARPFTTHHNALDRDLYLRIATELYLKRLIVGGLERVYELGKDFRNEGVSHKHNPEFTMLEWYEAYADYEDAARLLEELVSDVAAQVGYEGDLDLTRPWRRATLREAIREVTGVDILERRARFEDQVRQTGEGAEETQPFDEDFLRALEHGMRPTGGAGLGIDRLMMVLSGRTSIREVVLFPAMRT